MKDARRLMLASELWSGELTAVETRSKRVLLARIEGKVFGYRDHCPHLGVRLSEGKLEGSVLTCRAHQWQYDVTTGRCLNPESVTLDCVKVNERDGWIELDSNEGDRD